MTFAERTPFAQALLDAALDSFADVPAEETLDLQFSPALEKKLAGLMKSTRTDTYHPIGKTVRRAILIAALIAALAGTAMAIPAIRKLFIPYEIKNAGTHYEFTLETESAVVAPDRIEKVYRPFYIPEGFAQESLVITEDFACYAWFTENNDCIFFDQFVISKYDNNSGPSAENVETQTLLLNGYEVFCVYYDEGGASYQWTDNAYFYMLYCDDCISEADRNAIFYSIAVDEKANIP